MAFSYESTSFCMSLSERVNGIWNIFYARHSAADGFAVIGMDSLLYMNVVSI
jgi:hypothetical protein